jgi:hypothetical protein
MRALPGWRRFFMGDGFVSYTLTIVGASLLAMAAWQSH